MRVLLFTPLLLKFCEKWQTLLDRGKRKISEFRGIPALRIRYTDRHGLKRNNTEQNSDKLKVTSQALRIWHADYADYAD